LKNNTVHGINKPWTEKTSAEDLKNSEFGKILIESLQKKQTDKKWEDNFHSK